MGSYEPVCPPKRKRTYYEADNGDDGVNAIVAPYLPDDRNVVVVPMICVVHKCGDVRRAECEEEQFKEHL